MEYNKIIAVTGIPGLFELLNSKNDGAIVRSLEDKSSRFIASRVHNFSHLESIEVYTTRENVNLSDVFKAMENAGESLPAEKDAAAVKTYFQKVFPAMDFERVYNSDMKKMVKWYTILKNNNVEIKLSEAAAEEEVPVAETEAPVATEKAEAKPKKAAKAKEEAAATEEAEAPKAPKAKKAATKKAAPAEKDGEGEEAKPKKTARKKKTEE